MQIEIAHNAMSFHLTSKSETVIKEWLGEMAEMIISANSTDHTMIRIYPTNESEERLVREGRAYQSRLDPKALREIGDMFHAMAFDRQKELEKQNKKQ